MMKYLYLFIMLLLVGCSSTKEVEPVVITKVVAVPERYLLCDVKTPEKPVFPLDVVDYTKPLVALLGEALAEIEIRAAYEERLRTSLGICKGEGR